MKFHLTKLKNGLPIITVPMPTLESATVTVWVGVGSRYETKRVSGISHFLEHMSFKGSKKRPSARAVSEAVDAIGGEFNASTSKEWTNFYIRSRSATLPLAFDVLSDIVLNPLIKVDDIKVEKGVIVEEIGMYEDTPMSRIGDIFEQLIFEGHPLAMDITGTKKTVTQIQRPDFVKFRKENYFAKNMLVTVSGGVSEKQVVNLAKAHLGDFKSGKRNKTSKFKGIQKKAKVRLVSKKIDQAHLILGFGAKQLGHKDRYTETVLNAILGGGMSSRLFTEVREKRGLAYAVRSAFDRLIDTGYFAVYAGVDIKKAPEAIKVILEQLNGLAEGKLVPDKKEMKKAKEYVKGHFALSLEDTRSVNGFFGGEQLILGKIRTPEEVISNIEKVTTEEVLKAAKNIFKMEKANLAIIGPYKNATKFEKILK